MEAKLTTRVRELVGQYHDHKPRNMYIPMKEIAPYGLYALELENPKWVKRLAVGYGIRHAIANAYKTFRYYGLPYISSNKPGQGHVLLDINSVQAARLWDSKFDAQNKRKNIWKQEQRLDEALFTKCLNECKVEQARKELVAIAVKHKIAV